MKLLIIEDTFIPNATDPDREAVALMRYSLVETDKDTARRLVEAGRALYTERRDDPAKGARVASAELLDAAAAAAKAATDPA